MSTRVAPAKSPPMALVAPFLLAGAGFLAVGGALIADAPRATFAGINLPHTVAITHALVLGWVTTTMMGVLYQMAPVVIGGEVLSERLARVQFTLHVAGVAVFVYALGRWDTGAMAVAGVCVALSLALFATNIGAALLRAPTWSAPRAAVALSLTAMAATAAIGVMWVLALRELWFPITLGRLSAHAHVGLLGWLAMTLMGLSYQLVPMFNVVTRSKPRRPYAVLAAFAASVALLAAGLALDPPAIVRLVLALPASVVVSFWGWDVARLLRARSKAKLDVQGRATLVSLAFLALAVPSALAAAAGPLLLPASDSARALLAYAAAGLGGWLGIALVGNSFRVLPFLVWYHRYRPLVGRAPVPVVDDIYSTPAAHLVVAGLATAVLLAYCGAIAGNLPLFRTAGVLLIATGLLHAAAMLHMFLPKRSSRALHPASRPVAR